MSLWNRITFHMSLTELPHFPKCNMHFFPQIVPKNLMHMGNDKIPNKCAEFCRIV